MDYTIFQGSNAFIDVKTISSVFVMCDGMNKYISDNIVNTDGGLKIKLESSITSGYVPGRYSYQVVNEDGLEKQGKLQVKPNLLFTDSVESYWKKVITAIDERLAGKSSEAASSIHVGDKAIAYMTIDELLKLRDFAVQRLSEEGEDENVSSPNNEKTILYRWRLR